MSINKKKLCGPQNDIQVGIYEPQASIWMSQFCMYILKSQIDIKEGRITEVLYYDFITAMYNKHPMRSKRPSRF